MESVADMGYTDLDYNEIVFPRLGVDVHVNATAFTIFGLDVQWYGILIVIGLMLAMAYAYKNMRRVGIDADRATDAIIGGILAALVGARAYYVIFNWKEYKDNIVSIFNTREGGLAVFGGLIGAVLVGGIICKVRKVKFLPMMDLCGVGFLIGQGIGRWGNFFNQEAFGTNTDSLFCMTGGKAQQWIAMKQSLGASLDPNYAVHPCFLYESAWCLLGAVLLAIVSKKWRKFDGQIILMYMIWYGAARFFIEGIRTDSLTIGTLRVSQALSAVICVGSLITLLIMLNKVKRMGRDYKLYADTPESKALLAEADKRAAEEAAKRTAKKAAKTETAPAEPILSEDNLPEAETPSVETAEETPKD